MPPKKTKVDKATRVKAVARKRVGPPKAARVLDERQLREKPKHKRDWTDLIAHE